MLILLCLFLFFVFLVIVPDGRLTEQEALEEIHELYNQLQMLRDRVPMRGTAISTISTLIDNCKVTSNSLTLKPPPSVVGVKKSGFILNTSSTLCSTNNVIQLIDKSTNTNTTAQTYGIDCIRDDKGNVNEYERQSIYLNKTTTNGGVACTTQISITDDCDKIETDNSCQQKYQHKQILHTCACKKKNDRHIQCVGMSTTCSSNLEESNNVKQELNFSNLKLRCMCSGGEDSVVGGERGDSASASDNYTASHKNKTRNNDVSSGANAGGNNDVNKDGDDDDDDINISNVESVSNIEVIDTCQRCYSCNHCCQCNQTKINNRHNNSNIDNSTVPESLTALCKNQCKLSNSNSFPKYCSNVNNSCSNVSLNKNCDVVCKDKGNSEPKSGCHNVCLVTYDYEKTINEINLVVQHKQCEADLCDLTDKNNIHHSFSYIKGCNALSNIKENKNTSSSCCSDSDNNTKTIEQPKAKQNFNLTLKCSELCTEHEQKIISGDDESNLYNEPDVTVIDVGVDVVAAAAAAASVAAAAVIDVNDEDIVAPTTPSPTVSSDEKLLTNDDEIDDGGSSEAGMGTNVTTPNERVTESDNNKLSENFTLDLNNRQKYTKDISSLRSSNNNVL